MSHQQHNRFDEKRHSTRFGRGVMAAALGTAATLSAALALRGAGSPTMAAQIPAPQIFAAAALGMMSQGDWIDLGSGNWIWRPTDICSHPWDIVFADSEQVYKTDSQKNPTARDYNSTEQAALFSEWGNCGNGNWDPPTLPPILPPGDGPLPPPNRPDPICAGFGCTLDPPIGPRPGKIPPDPIWCNGLPCGWPNPLPAPGGGQPDPIYWCAGLNCPGMVAPQPPPSPPGPNPWEYCAGLNCPGMTPPVSPGPPPCGGGGGGSPCLSMNPEDCEPKGPIEIPPLNPPPPPQMPPQLNPPQDIIWAGAGPATVTATPYPVSFAHGHKHESAIDVVVALTGRDFVLSRSYTSKADMGGSGMIGKNWSMNLVQFLEKVGTGSTAPLRVSTPSGGSRTFTYNSQQQKWLPPGPSSQHIVKTTVNIGGTTWPVYRLVEAGAWSVDFYRTKDIGESATVPAAALIGLMLQEREVYEANKTTYTYTIYNQNNGNLNDDVARIAVAYLNGTSASNCAASVHFEWHELNDESLGRLKKVTIKRYPSGGSVTDVEKVEYTYKKPSDGNSSAVGTTGDLIQVVKSVLVDRAPSGESPWHITVTQYRYHNGGTAENGTDGDSDGFAYEYGNAHQLKAVILPAQIEYAAQKAASGTPHFDTVKTFANTLLTKADGDTAFTDGSAYKVMDLAAKVVERYETFDSQNPTTYPGRVVTQYLQSACGCSSGSAQGLKLEYTYWHGYASNPSDGAYARTTVVDYYQRDEQGGFNLHLTYYYDLVKYTVSSGSSTAPTYYLANIAVEESPSKRWVVHSDYDSTTRVRTRMISTSAIASYTPASATSAPSATFQTGQGLVQEYEYTAEHRMKQAAVRRGTNGAVNIVTRTTFDTNRPWLPIKHEAFRNEDLSSGNSSSGADDIQTVELTYGFHNGDAIAWIETQFEAEAGAENGPGGSYYSHSFFDTRGRNHWSRQADDVLIKRTFDDATGAMLTSQANATNSGLPSHPSTQGVSWNGRNGQGGSLTTTYTYDLLGRIRTMTAPTGLVVRFSRELRAFDDSHHDDRPGILYYGVVSLPHHFTESSQDRFAGPVNVELFNASGGFIAAIDYSLTSDAQNGYGSLFSGYAFNLDDELARATVTHGLTGLVMKSTSWHSVAGQGENGGYYETTYQYDTLGRLSRIDDPAGNRTEYDYDSRSRVIAVRSAANGQTLQTLVEMFYDSGSPPQASQGVGDGVITLIRQHTGENSGTEVRDTKLTYDHRSRVVKIENAVAPHAFFVYDNVDRIAKAALFSQLPSGSAPADIDDSSKLQYRGMYAESSYSQRGMAYRQRIAIDSTVASPTFLETHTWHDALGRVVGHWGPNAPGVKITYNALGQVVTAYVTDRGGDGLPGSGSLAHVYDGAPDYKANLSNDVVFQQTSYTYRAGMGLLDLVTTRVRTHDAGDNKTGDLASFSGGDASLVIASFTGAEYDKAGRIVGVVEFGTNTSGFNYGGSAPSLDTNDPPRWITSGPEITIGLAYGIDGQIETVTDPLNRKTKLFYDDLGRQIATIENHNLAGITWDSNNQRWAVTGISSGVVDQDRVTSIVYTITQNKVEQVAHQIASGGSTDTPQITTYLTAYDSNVTQDLSKANGLLRRIVYPDVETSIDDHSVVFAYNRLGQVRYTRDQNATTHTFTRDVLGRVTQDLAAVDSNGPIDGTIDKIEVAYDSFGRPQLVQSKSGSTVKNAVEFTYTKLWQIKDIIQEPLGSITGSSKKVTHAYETVQATTSEGNFSRPLSMTYPDGTVLTVEYEPLWVSGHTSDYRISRPIGLKLGSQSVVAYRYIGLSGVAVVDYPVPDVQLDRSLAFDGSRTSGQYPGLDRFGRIVRHTWADGNIAAGTGSGAGYPTTPPIVSLAYFYDKASNITEKYDARPGAKQALNRQYEYDDLHRLQEAKRGSGNGGNFTQATGSQQWNLGVIGNWSSFDTDLNGDGQYQGSSDRIVAGSFNDVNEISQLIQTLQGNQTTLAFTYDKAGNLREQALTSTTELRFTHDAWNRLVKVDYVSTASFPETVRPRGEYEYNGLFQRVIKRSDRDITDLSNNLDEQRLLYYSGAWQIVEERVDDNWSSGHTTDRIVQHVWGLRYIDDLVLNRQDSNADGDYIDSGDFTHYALTDHQFSVIALIDSAANLIERVSYTPYGEARHHWMQDVDGDGDIDATDQSAVTAALNNRIYQANYNVDADFNRDGLIDSNDSRQIGSGSFRGALPGGWISSLNAGNVIGFSGYVFNREIDAGGLYTVRFRHYDPVWGRWTSRDPAGYQDSHSLYGYGWGDPTFIRDPFGLFSVWDCAKGLGAGLAGGAWDFVSGVGSFLWNLTWHPIDTVNGIIDGVTELAAAVADGDLMEALSIVAPELHELISNWNNLSDYDKCRLMGQILGQYGTAALTGVGIAKLLKRLKAFKEGAPAGSPGGAFGCFVAGTLVLTACGPVPIEEVAPGDYVWSYDQSDGEWGLTEILSIQSRQYSGDVVSLMVQVNAHVETFACTGGHPYFVVRGERLAERPSCKELSSPESMETSAGRWIEARWLQLRDVFLTQSGAPAIVVGLNSKLDSVRVYNLQIGVLEVYSIGNDGILVHNSTPAGRPFTKHGAEDAIKRKIPGSVIDDTIDNYPGVPGGDGKTVYYSPDNNVTVVTGDGGGIVSCRKGKPRPGQLPPAGGGGGGS